jgi:DNA-binding NtrC family response regulator
LRDRVEDTAALSGHFIAHYNRSFGKHVRHISREALELMRNYGWPGNVRELAHTIEHAALMCGNDRIGAADLPSDLIAEATARITAGGRESITSGSGIASLSALIATNLSMPANITLDQAMKSAVARSLAAARGDCARAARSLGISRPSIYRKMARYGLQSSGAGIVNAEGAAIQLKPPDNADDR